MAFLLLILLASTLIFLMYYELIWKGFERERGRSLVGMAGDFLFKEDPKATPASSNAWNDWKYRLTAELHRRERLNPQKAAQLVGASTSDVEQYLDELESEGKVRQVGDAERGVFYKIVNES
jgi:hypothetical protein